MTRTEVSGPDGVVFVVDVVGNRASAHQVVWLHGELGALDEPPFSGELLERAAAFVPHLPGWGVSTGGERFPTLGELATGMWWLLEQLDVRRPLLAGHAFGATLAAEMAAQQPERVTAAVLATPFGIVAAEDPGADLFGLMQRDLMPMIYADPSSPLVGRHFPKPQDARDAAEATIRRTEVLGAASRYLFPVPDTGIERRTYRLADVPVTLLFGAQDGLVPAAIADRWSAALPAGEVRVVEGASHMLPYETDEVSVALAGHLRASVGGG